MPYVMCVTHGLIAKINRKNILMLKAEVVLNVMRSENKYYSKLKTYFRM